MIESSLLENYANKSTNTPASTTTTTTTTLPGKLKANVTLTSENKKLIKAVTNNLSQLNKSSLGGDSSTGTSFTTTTTSSSIASSTVSLTDKAYQITNSLGDACNLLNDKSTAVGATTTSSVVATTTTATPRHVLQQQSSLPTPTLVAPQPPAPPQKLKIICKSSGYNVKEICNNLYEIDEHTHRDLLVDYFFSDNYHLDPVVNPLPTATVVPANALNSSNSNGGHNVYNYGGYNSNYNSSSSNSNNNNNTNYTNNVSGSNNNASSSGNNTASNGQYGAGKLVVVWNNNQNNALGNALNLVGKMLQQIRYKCIIATSRFA